MNRIEEIRKRFYGAKEVGLTGWNLASGVYDAYIKDIPFLLLEIERLTKERDALHNALADHESCTDCKYCDDCECNNSVGCSAVNWKWRGTGEEENESK